MARKHLLSNIGAQPNKPTETAAKGESRVDYARRGASRSMMQSLDDLAENSMRVLEGDVVVSLDPEKLDPSPYQDRIGEDPVKDQELLEAIKEAGQHQPVLVRPSPDDSARHIIVFGHRRVRVAKKLGQKVRAVVKPLEEIAHVIAQGQENSARDDLSFIEKSLYARRLQESGIDKATIKTALTIDDTLLSRMLSVAETVPAPVLNALGAAKGVGRDRWEDLKKIVQAPAKSALALELIQSDAFIELEEGGRFGFLIEKLKVSRATKSKKQRPAEKAWSLSDDAVKVSTKDSGKAFTLALKSKDASRFGAYLSNRLEHLYLEFQRDGEGGSD
ncbi:plasmid partitioning protein RepB [Roseibium aggregatum]|jgi:ParB family chromosome partitioning protein|uniref:plasmid partitioning protein RepB n=1 Tax=Roseibium aggregatum TaxID=187304 RepID=UPI001E5603FE|nr:plasmid partitioning protein RepB [Roseibium aggregatum]UES41939.1 plasmid partitioning protein RepB [Roseibium aggregatum]UES48017.1 plasmid partitioning protein RepB [Roseibium aggregatum]